MTIIATEYNKKTFVQNYIPAYEEFEENLIDAICFELNLSEYVAKMGKDHFLAFIELIEIFGHDNVFEEQNEKLRSAFEKRWMSYVVEMVKEFLPNQKIDPTPDFGELDDLLRTHFGLY